MFVKGKNSSFGDEFEIVITVTKLPRISWTIEPTGESHGAKLRSNILFRLRFQNHAPRLSISYMFTMVFDPINCLTQAIELRLKYAQIKSQNLVKYWKKLEEDELISRGQNSI